MSNDDSSVEPPWTILRILQWTAGYFADHGIENPRIDSEILLAETLGCQRIDLYLRYDQPLNPDELRRFKQRIQRRAKREPVAYILGTKEFWSLDFHVTPDVLIPRPETEGLVETALALFKKDAPLHVLELGTGSGIITIALAHECTDWRFWASDLSDDALDIARSNAHAHGVEERIIFTKGSWFNGVGEGPDEGFDLILSNPPYISEADMAKLAPEISQYEPRLALDGGPDGLESINRIIGTAPAYLKPGGWLLLEIGHDQGAAVKELARNARLFDQIAVGQDYSGLDRIARCRKVRPAG